MLPTAMAGVAVNSTLTYQNVPFSGGGEDRWGITTSNRTLPHVDAPVAYAWMFSDGTTSGLRSPVRSFSEVGVINASLCDGRRRGMVTLESGLREHHR